MKLQKSAVIATTDWKHFTFNVGKGSQIKHIIAMGDYQFDNSGQFVYVFARATEISATPDQNSAYDIIDSVHAVNSGAVPVGGIQTPHTYHPYTLWDKEVFSIGSTYYVSVYNGTANGHNFQIDLIYEKKKGKK